MSTNTYLPSKPRYEMLDGLRGVAAIMVVIYHICESHWGMIYQPFGHSYLAVDFFYVLSGFVIGYAYDDRWNTMTTWNFFKRRITRLHPMVVLGSIVGLICAIFLTGHWVHESSPLEVAMFVFFVCCMIPTTKGGEMFSLNGPQWTLFFEYGANILYALVVRRFSKVVLSIFVALCGCWTLFYLLTGPFDFYGGFFKCTLIGGWGINDVQFFVGLTRLMYPFFAGLLLFRLGKRICIKHYGFVWCSLLLAAVLLVPTLGEKVMSPEGMPTRPDAWKNGLYEAFVVIVMFPTIVAMGAGSPLEGKKLTAVCKFLGEISYPTYILHYGFIHLYSQYITEGKDKLPLSETWPMALLVVVGSVAFAWVMLHIYDVPVRNWLKKHWLMK